MLNLSSAPRFVGLSLLIALVVAGCAADDKPGNSKAYQTGSSEALCSSQFVSDYNSVVSSVRIMSTVSDAEAARAKAVAFKNEYDGVKCMAELNGSKQQIDATAKMNEVIGAIDRIIEQTRKRGELQPEEPTPSATPASASGGSSGSANCTDRFIDDYNDVLRDLRGMQTYSDARAVREKCRAFKSKYPHVVCRASQGIGEPVTIDSDARMDKIISGIDGILQDAPTPSPSVSASPSASPSPRISTGRMDGDSDLDMDGPSPESQPTLELQEIQAL